MIIEKKLIKDLQPAPYNPRQSTKKQEGNLKASLEKFGVVEPIIFNSRTGYIVGGHFRVRELKKLGYKEVECVIVDLDEQDEKELNIRLNANTGEWDWDLLANEWDTTELEDWGLDLPADIETEELEAQEDDYEQPDQITTDIVLGDLFEFRKDGKSLHRLLCGDSTSVDDVEKLMNGEKADMVFTDPPYGMFLDVKMSERQVTKGDWVSKPKKYSKVIGDNDDFTPDLINTIFANFGYCKEIFIWGADYFAETIPSKNEGSWIVWDKRFGVESMQWSTSEFELCWSKQKHHRKIARVTWSGILGTEQEHDHSDGRQHPTQKPSLLAKWFFNRWGNEKDLVADLYLGSGSTMVASHQLNRRCYGLELDPKYCQVIIDRMKKLDPELEVIKIN